jgi:hypothetical protein
MDNQNIKGRSQLANILLILGLILFPFAVVSIWLRSTILNTDTYVKTVAPLSKNEAVSQALADYISTQLFQKVNIEDRVEEALPQEAGFLAAPIADEVESFTEETINRFISSDQFNQLWIEVNKKAHQEIVKLLTGQGEAVVVEEGTVTLDLENVFNQVKARLNERGINIFDNVTLSEENQQLVLFQSERLANVQSAIDSLNRLAVILPLFSLIAFVVSIWLSPERLRTAYRLGIGLIIVAAVLTLMIVGGRWLFIDAAQNLSTSAATAIFDTLVRFLWSAVLITFLAGLFAIIGIKLAKRKLLQ